MDNFRDSYFPVTWDLTKKHLRGTFWGKQYDTGRGFAVTIVEGGQVTVPSTETVRLKWEKPDSTEGYVTAVVVDGKFLIENIDQMFTVHGAVRSDLEIWRGGKVISSITFYVSVEKAVAVDAIESSSQFTALQTAIGTVDSVQAEIIDARDGAATLGESLAGVKSQLEQMPTNLSKFPRVSPEINDFGRIQRALNSFPANGGVLEIPVGEYFIPDGGLICDKPITIQGAGAGTYESGGTRFICDSPTATLLTLTKPGTVISGIAFMYTGLLRATSGAGILATDFDFGRIERCLFRGFWNNVQVDSGYFYSIRDTAFLAPVNYGCYMRNTAAGQHDHGDQVLEGCNFSKYGDTNSGGTAVRWESGGGLRIVACKVNAGTQPGYTDTGFFDNGFVTVMQPGGTSVHTITGCSVEGWLNHGISVSGVANATFGKISIVGNEFLASGSGGACVHADGNNMDSLDNLVITGNVGYGYSGGVMLYDLSKAVVTGNNFADCVQAGMTIANVTDLIQSDNLFKTSVWDLDASNFASAKAGHRRKSWEWGHDVYNNVGTFLAGKICPGEYAEIIVSVKVYGNVSTVGGFIMEQKRAVARVLNNAIVTQTIGTDISVGAGAAEIAITYDVDTSPTYVVPKITTINGKSFTGAVEVSVDGPVFSIYYQ